MTGPVAAELLLPALDASSGKAVRDAVREVSTAVVARVALVLVPVVAGGRS